MPQLRAREGEEIWETTTDGTVWVTMTDERGKVQQKSFGGKAGTRMRIKTIDRLANEDAVYGESIFDNGLLIRIDAEAERDPDKAQNAMSTEELVAGFSKSGAAFRAFVDRLNELNTRRMRSMCEIQDASQSQLAYLDKVIKERYRVEGDTPTYRELKAMPN